MTTKLVICDIDATLVNEKKLRADFNAKVDEIIDAMGKLK